VWGIPLKIDLTASRLRELLHYDPETGVFTHICPRQRVVLGSVAGSLGQNGYRKHRLDGVTFSGHRLAWLYMTGDWPKGQIDHINGIRDDNRISNLRDVPQAINSQNRRTALNSTGFLGVSKHHKQFRAEISMNNRAVVLGTFRTPEEAHAVYVQAKRKMHAGCTI